MASSIEVVPWPPQGTLWGRRCYLKAQMCPIWCCVHWSLSISTFDHRYFQEQSLRLRERRTIVEGQQACALFELPKKYATPYCSGYCWRYHFPVKSCQQIVLHRLRRRIFPRRHPQAPSSSASLRSSASVYPCCYERLYSRVSSLINWFLVGGHKTGDWAVLCLQPIITTATWPLF